MKKAGVITIFGEYNFGNRLQNYAVQEVLKNKGLEVETIKYIRTTFMDPIVETEKDKERLCSFKEFNKLIKFGDEILYIDLDAPKNYADQYDYIVMGSDQVWNYTFRMFTDKILGSFAPKHKKISFSASFGIDNIPEENVDIYNMYKKYLHDIKAISVREDAGKEIVKKLTGREDVEVLVDPTMMLTDKDWEKVMKRPKKLKTDKFIVKSFLGEISEEAWSELKRVAKENECEIIDISDKDSDFYGVGPAEFLYLEKNAYLVATDSFHACVFSILFSTPFVVFERQDNLKSMHSRIETLLNKFELKNRIFRDRITDDILSNNYSNVQILLQEERKKVNKFLDKALN